MKRCDWACAAALALLCGCSGASATGPAGWSRVPGKTSEWNLGSGAAQQSYSTAGAPFAGTVAELAARETIAVVLGMHGAHLLGVRPYPACPGIAGIATFSVGARIVEEAYTIRDQRAITVRYERPKSVSDSPTATAAMQRTVCVPPA